MLKRPKPHPALSVLRLSFTGLLLLHVFISAWLVATVDAAYTEGRPAPTEIHSIVAVDKDQTAIDVKMEKATSFVLYSLQRDRQVETNASDENTEGDSEVTESSDTDWLGLGRLFVTTSFLLLLIAEFAVWKGFKWARAWRVGAFSLALLAIFILFPTAYVADLGGQSTAQSSPGFDLENSAFAHPEARSDLNLKWLGMELEASFSGYDLGLVQPENRTNVSQAVPLNGTPDAKSFIAFESTFSIEYGKNLDALFVVPFLWLVFPASKPTSTNLEEE